MNSDSLEEPKPEQLNFSPTTSEERQAAREYEKIARMMKTEAENKRNNVLLYQRHRNELDPILDDLQKLISSP